MDDDSHHRIEVRPARSEDLDSLTALSVGIQALHAEGLPRLFRAPDVSALRSFMLERLDAGDLVLVAECRRTVVGYVLAEIVKHGQTPFRRASSLLYIHHLAVAPTAQGQGAGTLLVEALEQRAAAEGLESIRLDSWAFNTSAHAFFARLGFEPLNIVFEHRRPGRG